MITDEKMKERIREAVDEEESEEDQESKKRKKIEALKEMAARGKEKISKRGEAEIKRLLKEAKQGKSRAGEKVKEIAANVVVRGKDTANALGDIPSLSLGRQMETTPDIGVDLDVRGKKKKSKEKTRDFSLKGKDIDYMGEGGNNKFFKKDKKLDLY